VKPMVKEDDVLDNRRKGPSGIGGERRWCMCINLSKCVCGINCDIVCVVYIHREWEVNDILLLCMIE